MKNRGIIIAILLGTCVTTAARSASAGPGDAVIQYNLGLAVQAKGDLDRAYKFFKKACMAADGLAEACLAWGELAQARENSKDVKRALGSAVMFAPDDVRARYAIAMHLLKKQDWTWAIEHLTAAVPNAETDKNRSVLRYYLGYALYKNEDYDKAGKQLSLARAHLPPCLKQRCDFYRALIAAKQEKKYKSFALMKDAATGPNPAWSKAANGYLSANSAFSRRDGFGGRVSASFGLNTRATSAVLDTPGSAETRPVLQSVFRGDVVYTKGNYGHGFKGMVTAYREQNWVEVGEEKVVSQDDEEAVEDSGFTPQDFNMTAFLAQAAYLRRFWLGGIEHELLVSTDGEVVLLDFVPTNVSNTPNEPEYVPGTKAFQPFGWALGGKAWWTLALSDDVKYGIRLKAEGRPQNIDKNRSTARIRLRLTHERHFLDRVLRLQLLLGGRYDRSYHDDTIVKYDRLLPELEAKLRWRTPVPRLTWLVGAKAKYNWYMNSRGDEDNSFRPVFVEPIGESENEIAAKETEYYDVTRQDFEWELNTEIQVALWWKATLALTYKHFQRISNMDDAPTPIVDDIRLPQVEFGYVQDIVMLDLRQGF
ncbi:MAG: hypothetical protein GY854_22000 [Deltaproteobacteria bacterium]|nr:hypothetical protein [Deltaproteobacteria bacterium]